jgi:hypothetical protein
MFKQSTSAALAVLSFPELFRQGWSFGVHGGGGVGLPHVRWRLEDQKGMEGVASGTSSSWTGTSSRSACELLDWDGWDER